MSVHDKDLPLTHAKNAMGEWVYVRKAKPGIECGCKCPICNEALIAKPCFNGGKAPHFAHVSGVECHGAQMSALHQRAQEIIKEKKAVMAPEYIKNYKKIEAKSFEFVDVDLENQKEWKDIRPDIIGETADGKKWAIEIFYTNEVNKVKEEKIKNNGVACFEIDITKQSFEQLEGFLLNSCDDRRWINNPYYDQLIREMPSKNGVPEIVEHSFPANCNSLEDFYNYLREGCKFYWGAKCYNVYDYELTPDCSALWVVHYTPNRNMPPYKLTKFYINENKLYGETITMSYSKIKARWEKISAKIIVSSDNDDVAIF